MFYENHLTKRSLTIIVLSCPPAQPSKTMIGSIGNSRKMKMVSIKYGLWTADYGLRTGYKIWTRYKTRTGKYGLGIKHRLGIKRGLQAADWV